MQQDKFTKEAPGELIKAIDGHMTFLPKALPPELIYDQYLVKYLSNADLALGALSGISKELPNPHLLVKPFLNREAVLSSQIEGTITRLDQLFLFEMEPEKEHPADAQEVLNYVRAVSFGLEQIDNGHPINVTLICALHRVLLENVRGSNKNPGKLRDRAVFLGKTGQDIDAARFVPPCHTQVKLLLEQLVDFIKQKTITPIVVLLALVHYQFETIHPFNDGNGRLGRLLIILILYQKKFLPEPLLYLSAYFERHRQEYYDALLGVSQNNAWKEWIAFFAQGVAEQASDSLARAHILLRLRQYYRDKVTSSVKSALPLKILDEVFVLPFITVNGVKERSKTSYNTAQTSIKKLVELRILKEHTGKERNRVYVADEIIRVLELTTEELFAEKKD